MAFSFVLPGLFVLLFGVLPGALFSLAFFRRVSIGVFSKMMLGAVFGLLAPPVLSFAEFVLFGVKYGFPVVLLNSLALWLAALAALYLQGMLSTKIFEEFGRKKFEEASTLPYAQAVPKYGAFAILCLLLFFSFHVRHSTAAAFNFFEFDPVYYNHLSEILYNQGEIPIHSFEVYWPQGRDIRGYPLVQYLTVGWMHASSVLGGLPATKEFVVAVSQLYPPLFAVLMVFLAYLLFKELFNEIVGLSAAAVFAFMPQLVKKMGAGVSELQPFGVFSAIFVFAAFALYLRHRDLRFAALAAFAVFASILGSAQSIWPVSIIAAAMALIALLDFRTRELRREEVAGAAIILAGGVLAGGFLQAFQGGSIFSLPNSIFFLFLGLVSAAVMWLAQQHLLPALLKGVGASERGEGGRENPVGEGHERTDGKKHGGTGLEEKLRWQIPIAFIVLGLLAVMLVPALNTKVVGYAVAATQFAEAGAALTKTVQEENPTTPAVYPSSFGSINPDFVLPIVFVLVAALPVFNFFKKNRLYGLLALAVVLLVTVFNPFLDSGLKGLVKGGAFGNEASLTDFISTSDVFLFTLVALALLFADTMANGSDNREMVFLSLAVFPVSYIGLRKLKFIVHLGVSLALAVPLLLGEGKRVLDWFQAFLSNESDRRMLFHATTFVTLVLGIFVTGALASTVSQSTGELQATRIPQDWLDAYNWMRQNPDMTEPRCVGEYGYDCRVLSWWDYGHWTTFFGGKKSVLDPGNAYPAMDQEVAQAFVNGEPEDLKYTVNYREATHILADSDLIGKWGALVFLSGTCSKKESPTCFDQPPIDFHSGAGQSKYELEHYYEYLQPVGQCPTGVTPIALPAFRSGLTGGIYCMSQSHLLLLTQNGLDASYKRPYKLLGRDEVDPKNLDANYSYVFKFGDTYINVNPDVSYAGAKNTVFNAAFTKLYFFENLPGTELAYRSPNSMVKIFKIKKGGPLLP